MLLKRHTVLQFAGIVIVGTALFIPPAEAKQVCGWYAIAFCSPSRDQATAFTNGGWGQTIETRKYQGLQPGLFCVASGPQPKASAERDRAAAIRNGVSATTYIKNACTDETNIGD